jgi:hypothetical protein
VRVVFYPDPGVYRCDHCGYTFAEIGALSALVRLHVSPPSEDGTRAVH